MFLSDEELRKIGFKSLGTNVLISNKVSIYGAEFISIGDNVRIDDFCILSGKITFGNNIHIGAGSVVIGGGGNDNVSVTFADFSGISSKCAIYATTKVFCDFNKANPMMIDFKKDSIADKSIYIGKHCVVGTGSTILPGANLAEGVAVGAMSLLTKPTKAWKIYAGIPARAIKERSKDLLDLEKEFMENCP